MKRNLKQSRQSLLHVGSVFVALTVIAIFFILRGNEDETPVYEEKVQGMNMELPDSEENNIKKNKLEAIVSEEERLLRERSRQIKQQNSSFDLMTSLQTQKKDTGAMSELYDENKIVSINENIEESKPSSEKNCRTSISGDADAAEPKKTNSDIQKDDWKEKMLKQREAEKKESRRRILQAYGFQEEEPASKPEPNAESKSVCAEESVPKKKKSGFRTMGGQKIEQQGNSIRAVVHGEQKDITTSSQVKLRILDAVTIDGIIIPRNTIIYGRASFSSNRMTIRTDNITFNNSVYPFKANIYDMDGFAGLYIPDNVLDEAKDEVGSSAVTGTNVNLSSMTGILNTAANATVNAVKSISNNKITEVKVTLPANYKLIIKKEK